MVLLLGSGLAPAVGAGGASVKELVDVVRSAIRRREPDSKLAKTLRNLTLKEKLDDRTIEELQSEGAGPLAAAELVDLRDSSDGLPPPVELPMFLSPPAPSRVEASSALNDAASYAVSYIRGLPDFICTQTVRRYEHFRSRGVDSWRPRDILTVKLTYFDFQEKYDLTAIDNHPTKVSYESAGGTVSEGEFGSILHEVFDPRSGTHFDWHHWTTLRGRAAYVFEFAIDAAHSTYRIKYGQPGISVEAVVGAHGFLYVDRETSQILRLIRVADIKPGFPVTSAAIWLDYDFADVAGRRYLLPLHVDLRMSTAPLSTRNDVSYHDYRKFTGDSSIKFDTPAENKP